MTNGSNIYENVRRQFNKAADLMNLDPDIRKILEKPMNEIEVNFPAIMDDGRVEMFTAYRIQHNNVLGPFKGGLRFHQSVDINEVRALATWMTWKTAIAGLPLGGAKGGIQFDPKHYSKTEVEKITRRFTFALGNNIGPEFDIPAPDMNTNAQIMAWILDTYISTVRPHERQRSYHVVTGKPVDLGGSVGRDKATGQGVAFLIQRWAEDTGLDLEDATYFVQGYGNVGSWAARLMKELGATLVAVEDASGAIANHAGIDPDELLEHTTAIKMRAARATDSMLVDGMVRDFPKAERIEHEPFLATEADIFIPAALENQITGETAPLLNVKLVAEGANGPTDTDGDAILQERNIHVIPDILCNSGGVIVSYFEWLQNRRSEFWDLEEVDRKLHKMLMKSYGRVKDKSEEVPTDWRTAAYIIALSRLEAVYQGRGIFP